MSRKVEVKAAFDDEAQVWFIEDSTLPGLAGEADTIEALAARLPDMVVDLIEANGLEGSGKTVEIELIARQAFSASVPTAA